MRSWLVMALCGCSTQGSAPPAPAHQPIIALAPAPPPAARPVDARVDELPPLAEHPFGRYDATPSTALRARFGAVRVRSCGVLAVDAPVAAASTARRCVREAVAASHPFLVEEALQGIDSAVANALIGVVEQGRFTVYRLAYDSDPCGGGCEGRGGTVAWRCTAPPVAEASSTLGVVDAFSCPMVAIDGWHAGEHTALDDRDAERVLTRLVGDAPATLGSAFGNVALGQVTSASRPLLVEPVRSGVVQAAAEVDAGRLRAIEISVAGHCAAFADRLAAAWGATRDDAWVDPVAHRRAQLDRGACVLRVDRYADLSELVTTVLPIASLGQPAAPLRARIARVHDVRSEDPAYFDWSDVGIGTTGGALSLHVSVERGRVGRVSATGHTDLATLDQLRSRLAALLGPPLNDGTQANGTRDTDWPRGMLAVGTDGSFVLEVSAGR